MKDKKQKKQQMQKEYADYEKDVNKKALELFKRPAYAYTSACKKEEYGVNRGRSKYGKR